MHGIKFLPGIAVQNQPVSWIYNNFSVKSSSLSRFTAQQKLYHSPQPHFPNVLNTKRQTLLSESQTSRFQQLQTVFQILLKHDRSKEKRLFMQTITLTSGILTNSE
jgi:hypothetical protein